MVFNEDSQHMDEGPIGKHHNSSLSPPLSLFSFSLGHSNFHKTVQNTLRYEFLEIVSIAWLQRGCKNRMSRVFEIPRVPDTRIYYMKPSK